MSKKRRAYLTAFLLLSGVVLWAFISAGVITHNFNREQVTGKGDSQAIDVSGMIITETKSDQKYWEIYGETGTYDTDNKVALLNNVVGNFYKNNHVTMSFQSSKGTYSEEKQQIILYDDTFIVIEDGTSLKADRLTWSGSDVDIVAHGHIKVNRDNELIATADKIVINPDYSKFKIYGKTQTKLYNIKEN